MASVKAEGAWPSDSELLIGLVAPIGVDLESIITRLTEELEAIDYSVAQVHLTAVLQSIQGEALADGPADQRYFDLMSRGNQFRSQLGRKDAMALLAVARIIQARTEMESSGIERRAYIIRQMKLPEEIETLRRLYGENFVVVAGTQPLSTRIARLAKKVSSSESRATSHASDETRAKALTERDERESVPGGQNLRDTFAEADLYVDPSDLNQLRLDVERFIDLLFERKVRTPTNSEFAMFSAWGSALRSGSLARQVGACVYSGGSVLSMGTNDVPKAHGGLYVEDDGLADQRDHIIGQDQSDARRHQVLSEVLEGLADNGWLAEHLIDKDFLDLAKAALIGETPFLKASRLNALVEFVRAAHAEQAAIADAARRGVPLAGASLAVTTFPCHECTRLLLAAGIQHVSYIEPYPKSLAADMYGDSIVLGEPDGERVPFVPFLGVAPRVYTRLFAIGLERKNLSGQVIVRHGQQCQLRLTYNGSRLDTEKSEKAALAALSLVEPQAAAGAATETVSHPPLTLESSAIIHEAGRHHNDRT